MKGRDILIPMNPWYQGMALASFLHAGLLLSSLSLFSSQTSKFSPPAEPFQVVFAEQPLGRLREHADVSNILSTPKQTSKKGSKSKALPTSKTNFHASRKLSPSRVATCVPQLRSAQYQGFGLNNAKPSYPKRARELGYQGSVILQVEVSAQGDPLKVHLLTSSGYMLLDESALKAIRQWHFIPATKDHKACASRITIQVHYSLEEQGQGKIYAG